MSTISLDIPVPNGLTIGEWKLHLNVVPCSVGAKLSLPLLCIYNLEYFLDLQIDQTTADSFTPGPGGTSVKYRKLIAALPQNYEKKVPAHHHLVTLNGARHTPTQLSIELDAFDPSIAKSEGKGSSCYDLSPLVGQPLVNFVHV